MKGVGTLKLTEKAAQVKTWVHSMSRSSDTNDSEHEIRRGGRKREGIRGRGTADRQRNSFERSGGQMCNILQTMQTGRETVAGIPERGSVQMRIILNQNAIVQNYNQEGRIRCLLLLHFHLITSDSKN